MKKRVVDFDERAFAAEVLADYRYGRVTDVQFEERYFLRSPWSDPAVGAIFSAVYMGMDDRKERFDVHAHPAAIEFLERCILFLGTHLPYEWAPRWNVVGRWRERSIADAAVWPFFRRADYERTRVVVRPRS